MTNSFSTPAIMLRRVDFGEHDLIITFFTLNQGKLPVIAKSAKKSVKRFSGILELFSVLDIVYTRGKGLPVLQEATLKQPFIKIRGDIKKTAYASYWAELINIWTEEEENQEKLYDLFLYVLEELDRENISKEILSILFQMRFMSLSGFYPNLSRCGKCGMDMQKMKKHRVIFDLPKGELRCENCLSPHSKHVYLSKGTIKQLEWLENRDLEKAARIRFSPPSLREGLDFLEAFVPYHLGKMPRSLSFLQQIR